MKAIKIVPFFMVLLISASCLDNKENKTVENSPNLTFETIEEGISIEDARKLISEDYVEHKIGDKPEIYVMLFEDKGQLSFVDGLLTDKMTQEELSQAMEEAKKHKS